MFGSRTTAATHYLCLVSTAGTYSWKSIVTADPKLNGD